MSDLISRQAAVDAIRAMQTYKLFAGDDLILVDQAGAQTELMMLPTAKPKKGEWKKSYADHEAFGVRPFFRYCSECCEATAHKYNFCPNCGADMRGEE